MKQLLSTIIGLLILIACSPTKQKVEQVSSIDSTLQTKVTSILENKLSEINEVLSGITIEVIAKNRTVMSIHKLIKINKDY